MGSQNPRCKKMQNKVRISLSFFLLLGFIASGKYTKNSLFNLVHSVQVFVGATRAFTSIRQGLGLLFSKLLAVSVTAATDLEIFLDPETFLLTSSDQTTISNKNIVKIIGSTGYGKIITDTSHTGLFYNVQESSCWQLSIPYYHSPFKIYNSRDAYLH
jgi:hypothetical protein